MAIHEECGVFGIYDPAGSCAQSAYYGLYALQHRGQEACGIATMNGLETEVPQGCGAGGRRVFPGNLGRVGRNHGGRAMCATATAGEGCRRRTPSRLTLKLRQGHPGGGPQRQSGQCGPGCARHFEYSGALFFQTCTDSEIIAVRHRPGDGCGAPPAERAVSLAMRSGSCGVLIPWWS